MTINEDSEEIYLERARYLSNIDDTLEQILEDQYNAIPVIQTSKKIIQEIGQGNNIIIDTEIPLAFAFNEGLQLS